MLPTSQEASQVFVDLVVLTLLRREQCLFPEMPILEILNSGNDEC